MCGGMPFMIASVMNILRKSWGVNRSGWPLASVSAGRGRARRSRQLADALGGDRPVLAAEAAAGTAAASAGSRRARGRRRRRPAGRRRRSPRIRLMIGDEHVGQLGADDQEPLGVGLGRGDLQQRDQLAGGRAAGTGSGCGGTVRSVPRCGCRSCRRTSIIGPGPERRGVPRRSGRGACRWRGPRPRSGRSSRSWHRRPGAASAPPAVNSSPGAAAPGGLQPLGGGVRSASAAARPGRAGRAAVRGSAGPSGTCGWRAVLACGRSSPSLTGQRHRPRPPAGRVVDRPTGRCRGRSARTVVSALRR